MGGIMDFMPRYQQYEQEINRTHEFVKDLMIYADSVEKRLQLDNADLRRQLQEAKFDLEDATNSRRDLQQRLITLESRADTTTIVEDNDTDRNPYVVLLLDGNGLLFKEDYVKRGHEGGVQAAIDLRNVIAAQCNDTAGEIKVIAKVYVDTNGLGQLLSDSGAVNSTDIVRDFMLGFAQAETSFDFIDVGHHSDQVRLKITDATSWHLKDVDCKQILLGVSHDAGFEAFAKDIVAKEELNKRVTILEGQPTTPQIKSTGVNIITFDRIFRPDMPVAQRPLVRSSTSTSSIAASTPEIAPSAPASVLSASPAPMTWATITRKASPPPVITFPIPLKTSTPSRSVSASKILPQPNWNPGPRGLDVPIPLSQSVLDTVKKRKESSKLCNNHYLRGPCTKGEDCCFEHNYKPNKEELNAIAFLARLNPCTSGQECDVDNCIYGHHCPSVVNNACVHPFCKFRAEEHPPGTKWKFPRE
ncbi:cleavage and polyadenylation specificity factor subunit 4 [Microdochium nivale]|nr:cleavage and polyadenylation specificity factor subunit 4 [Microdochium nivale]